jgi:hypothetical protein
MFWGCITFDGVATCTLTEIEGNMNTTKYLETLGDNVWTVITKIFPNGGYIFQDDNAPCHASRRAVSSEYKLEVSPTHIFFTSLARICLFKMSHSAV